MGEALGGQDRLGLEEAGDGGELVAREARIGAGRDGTPLPDGEKITEEIGRAAMGDQGGVARPEAPAGENGRPAQRLGAQLRARQAVAADEVGDTAESDRLQTHDVDYIPWADPAGRPAWLLPKGQETVRKWQARE
jgi:hypothetical protein